MILRINPVTCLKCKSQNQFSNAGSENQVYLLGEEKEQKIQESSALCSNTSVLWASIF